MGVLALVAAVQTRRLQAEDEQVANNLIAVLPQECLQLSHLWQFLEKQVLVGKERIGCIGAVDKCTPLRELPLLVPCHLNYNRSSITSSW
jgi:hypothetical protein